MKYDFNAAIKKSNHDEFYTRQSSVDMIVPYVVAGGFHKIWCPFDTKDSKFVITFQDLGFDVVYGHISTGQNFLYYDEPMGDIIVSNPPFSIRDDIFEKLCVWDLPYALIMNFNGLFDSKKRAELFRKHNVELLIPKGRMGFDYQGEHTDWKPNYQSIYVCNHLLGNQIVFDDTQF